MPQLLLWLTVVGSTGFAGFVGLLASGAGAAKALPARKTATVRMLVNCILVGMIVLNGGKRRMIVMIVCG